QASGVPLPSARVLEGRTCTGWRRHGAALWHAIQQGRAATAQCVQCDGCTCDDQAAHAHRPVPEGLSPMTNRREWRSHECPTELARVAESARFLSKAECEAIARRVFALMQGGGNGVVGIASWWQGELRW